MLSRRRRWYSQVLAWVRRACDLATSIEDEIDEEKTMLQKQLLSPNQRLVVKRIGIAITLISILVQVQSYFTWFIVYAHTAITGVTVFQAADNNTSSAWQGLDLSNRHPAALVQWPFPTALQAECLDSIRKEFSFDGQKGDEEACISAQEHGFQHEEMYCNWQYIIVRNPLDPKDDIQMLNPRWSPHPSTPIPTRISTETIALCPMSLHQHKRFAVIVVDFQDALNGRNSTAVFSDGLALCLQHSIDLFTAAQHLCPLP